jgi:hypothetical protein
MDDTRATPDSPGPDAQEQLNAVFAAVVASVRGAGRDPEALQEEIGAEVLYTLTQRAGEGEAWAQATLADVEGGNSAGFAAAARHAGLSKHGNTRAAGADIKDAAP